MDKATTYCNYNTPRDKWLSLDEYTPWWVPDVFMDEYILVCNKEEYSGEGFRRIPTPVNRGDTLNFKSVYVQDELVVPTHFMLISEPN